jgi:hypothetical protein
LKELLSQSADGFSTQEWGVVSHKLEHEAHNHVAGLDGNQPCIRYKLCAADLHRVLSAHGLRKPPNTHFPTHCTFRSSWRAFSPHNLFFMYMYTQSSTPCKPSRLKRLLAKEEEALYTQIHRDLSHPSSTSSFRISCRRQMCNPKGH